MARKLIRRFSIFLKTPPRRVRQQKFAGAEGGWAEGQACADPGEKIFVGNFVAYYWPNFCYIFLALKLYVKLLVYNDIPELLKYMSHFHSGAAVNMTLLCNEGHTENWCSSRTIKAGRLTVPLINLSLLFYSFLGGLHWDQLKVKSMKNLVFHYAARTHLVLHMLTLGKSVIHWAFELGGREALHLLYIIEKGSLEDP